MNPSITITVCFFAALSETLGTRQETVHLPANSTLQDLKKQLSERASEHAKEWQALNDTSILCALNHEMEHGQPTLQHGDEVAFFPPVTGG